MTTIIILCVNHHFKAPQSYLSSLYQVTVHEKTNHGRSYKLPFMEKILVAIDATKVNCKLLDFATYLARLTHSKINGVFLENCVEVTAPVMKSVFALPYVETVVAEITPEQRSLHEKSIQQFHEACEKRSTGSKVFHNHNLTDLIRESRYADVLVVDAEMQFNGKHEGTPGSVIKKILAQAECPVIIPPFHFDGIDEILFAYDGSFSSVFAMKQFTYLFPEFADKKLTVVEITDQKEVTEKQRLGDLISMHYSQIGYETIEGDVTGTLLARLLGKKNTFVIMGAFGQTMLSGFFRHSSAEMVIKTIDLPVFIAHH